MNPDKLEKYSSAITLSDMEIFVFPELMYSLVLANIMSPEIWKWREIDSFKKLDGKGAYKKLLRLKQFIIDEYEFNLDLETWGLTEQKRELERFKDFISPDDISRSNALFGYQGDKYYFDVDIRRHFGLDKYDSDIIPYWKTETIEAMNAFHLKKGYDAGAGECVSLSALYAAAAFVVCGIPLEDIFMVLTPLHSQNFININDGIITNNRRIATKTMWFNGTALSNKAQRAIRNEQVTIVAHNTGFIHCFYDTATIDKNSYNNFLNSLGNFLTAQLDLITFANFLRCNGKYQKYFMFCCDHCRGGQKFAKAEVLFHYEHGSRYRIADDTFEKLVEEVSEEDILPYKLTDRICCNQLLAFVEYENIDIKSKQGIEKIKTFLSPIVTEIDEFLDDLTSFLHIEPRLPGSDKKFSKITPIELSTDLTREQVIEKLSQIRETNITADLAFYAYRDMISCRWEPFLKAAIERNPVSLEITKNMSDEEVESWLKKLPDSSIYDSNRLAQPDEVANYETGDGLEKAILMANVLCKRYPDIALEIICDNSIVKLNGAEQYTFNSSKQLKKHITINQQREFSVS